MSYQNFVKQVGAVALSGLLITSAVQNTQAHWADTTLTNWVSAGLLEEEGSSPERVITTAEFVEMANKITEKDFTLETIQEINGLQDLKEHSSITREQVAVFITLLTDIKGSEEVYFQDHDAISPWAKESVSAVKEKGYLLGKGNNTFAGKDVLNLGEAVVILDKVREELLDMRSSDQENSKETIAREKIAVLEDLMEQAKEKEIDFFKEESTIFFANEFLKYASWDAANKDIIKLQYERFTQAMGLTVNADGSKLSGNPEDYLPEFQRDEVIAMVETSIAELQQVLSGAITRPDYPRVPWEEVSFVDGNIQANGQVYFLHDYFSKPFETPENDPTLYNDFLGNVISPPALAPNSVLNQEGDLDTYRLEEMKNTEDTGVGFGMLWHGPLPQWILEMDSEANKGTSYFSAYDIDNPLIRDAWSTVFENYIPVMDEKNYINLGYVLHNEPHWVSGTGHWAVTADVSTHTIAKFQEWLHARYETIEKLNENWGSEYKIFKK
ncbi:MAG: hypothetical protein R3Y63_07170 [Eubacteriales bacterium]